MSKITTVLLGFLFVLWVLFIFLSAMDLDVARRDYNEIKAGRKQAPVSNCIFSYNCNKYNELLEGQ